MQRLFVSAALLPLVFASAAAAQTKITTATTAPVRTSTAAAGQPDAIVIDTTGSIAPTSQGVAVTVDSSNAVVNLGTISFNNLGASTGVLVRGGPAMAVTNSGVISLVEDYTATDTDSDGDLDGPLAIGGFRYGIRVIGPEVVSGPITNSGTISIEGTNSAGISVETRLLGSVLHSGAITMVGEQNTGVRVDSISGDVKLLGTVTVQGEGSTAVQLGDVDGAVVLQNAISATGYRSTTRSTDATVRSKLDADDLKQGGPAVKIAGNVGRGVLLDKPPADNDANNSDEDGDGITDSTEATATITAYGAAPAIDIGGAGATTIGAVGTGDLGYGLVNRGVITADGVNDGIASVAVRIGQAGGGATTITGGINNQGGTIIGRAYGASATAVLLNPNAVVPVFINSGAIGAEQNGGLHDAHGLVDLSGTLALVQNSGSINAVVTPATGVTQTGSAVAIDLSANTSGAIVRQLKVATTDAPKITGEIRFGSGADRLELLGGTFAGVMNFGGGADTLVVDGGASATGTILDSDGKLAVNVLNGKLAVSNVGTVNLSSLNLGASGVLAVAIDPAATGPRLNVSGAATVATGAQVSVTLTALSRGSKSFQIVQAGSLTVGQAGATVVGSPFLYVANLRADTAAGGLYVDLRPKTAAELGLNRSGAEAYSAVFEALDKDNAIEAAFLSQTTQAGFQGLYDQMLPDHSGGVLMSAAAISSQVSQAVSEPQSIARDATTGAWISEIAFNIRQDRKDALGYRSQGFGFAAGLDTQGDTQALGVNMSLVTADIHDVGAATKEQVNMNLVGAGLYWRLDGGPLQASMRAGGGYAFMSGDRRLESPTLNLKAKGDWGAWQVDAYAGASYEWRAGNFYARPQVSTTYLRLAEDGYHEKGSSTGFNLTVDKRTGDLFTGQALLALGWRFGAVDSSWWAPEITGGYRAKFAGGPAKTTAHFDGGADFTLDPEDPFKGGYIVRAGFRGATGQTVYGVSGGATVDDNYQEYDVRAVVRVQF